MGFLSCTDVNAGSFDKGEKIMGEHSFCIFFFPATKHNKLQRMELVCGVGNMLSLGGSPFP